MPTEADIINISEIAAKAAAAVVERANIEQAAVLARANAAAATLQATQAQDLQYIKADISDIKKSLDGKYVTKEEFNVVRSIAYGLVGLICTGFVGAVLALVFKR